MKIVLISDTHGLHRVVGPKLPEADILIHAGDILNSGKRIEEVASYALWLKTESHKFNHIIQIAGNHDFHLQDQKRLCIEMMAEKIEEKFHYLENEEVVIDDIKFYGSPITPTFCNWAFMEDRGAPIKKYWDAIPEDVNVLITHGPPHGILDFVHYDKIHVGCEELKKKIDSLKNLKIHCFGHIHETRGIHEDNGVFYFNPSICDLHYNPWNKPIVIDYLQHANIISVIDS